MLSSEACRTMADMVPSRVVLLLVALVAYLMRPRSHTMYWRGRQIDLDGRQGPAQELYRRLFKR